MLLFFAYFFFSHNFIFDTNAIVIRKCDAIPLFVEKMRVKDIEQAILLEEKVRLHATYLRESCAQNVLEPDYAETFLTNCGSYKELITDNCDNVEICRRIFHTIQETSQLASNLHKAATGYELPSRSFSSVGERHSEQFQSPKLPTRAET